jgi:hypothetical protein
MFPIYGEKCSSRKAVHNEVANVSLMTKRLNGVAEVAETRVKRILLYCGFRSTGKTTGQVYQCWWRLGREINVFPRFKYHVFYINL